MILPLLAVFLLLSGPATAAPEPDTSCKADADCVVKNVGNCCGYNPRCVNVNAEVDPKAVIEECQRNGTAGVCGFQPIESCVCTEGQCQAKGSVPGGGPAIKRIDLM